MNRALRFSIAFLMLGFASAASASPEDDGNAGLDAMKSGDYAKAVQLFSRAIASGQMAPDDKEFAYVQRGTAYFNLGNNAAAKLDFERALKIKPDDNEAREGLEQTRASTGTSAHAGGGNAQNAQKAAQDAMEALNNRDYARAIALFSRVIASGRLSGDDLELAYTSRGQAYLKQGDFRLAAQDLNAALARKNDDADALQALGEALGHMPAPVLRSPVDEGLCKKNFTTNGSIISGKSYTTYVDYPGLNRQDGFAGLFRTIGKYTPTLQTWQIVGADMREGTIRALINFGDSGRKITQEDHLEQMGDLLRITMTVQVPGLLPTIDLKGVMCKTLAMHAK